MHIFLDLKIFLFVAIFIITRQIKIYGIIMLFAFIHECSHLIMGIMVGFKPLDLKITPYGFSIEFKNNENNMISKNKLHIKKLKIAIAGPIANLLCALLSYMYYYISKNTTIVGLEIENIIYSNILIFIFNLLPIYPLDGGRILKHVVLMRNDLLTTIRYIRKTSKTTVILITALASIVVLKYKNIAIIIMLAYLWYIYIKSFKKPCN